MRLSFLEPLYKQPGPFASVYLDTSRDSAIEDPDAAIELRWRHLRDALLSEERLDQVLTDTGTLNTRIKDILDRLTQQWACMCCWWS
ncbi:hypothetical protein SAZ11_04315 [Streptomyces sp. FXJ1.4098]|uniref:hypothetical protein n=1 Tax=Streptomyces sp. NPDC020845 TaxID=3365096 RepID=UPI00299A84B6|nr:hypothetical protein [Streptomyces sp. FXJ1.4098]